jgi:hypothetical protein
VLAIASLGGCRTVPEPKPNPTPAEGPTLRRDESALQSTPAPAPAARPVQPTTEGRLANTGLIIDTFATRHWAKDLEQMPSSVIENGVFRFVPYLSYRADRFELNIYGDPQHPAGVEIGVYAGKEATKEEIRTLLAGLLQRPEDRELIRQLSLDEDELERAGLTFKVTPPTADDAYGGWWLSIYDVKAIDRARASDEDMRVITVTEPTGNPQAPAKTKRSRRPSQSPRVYVPDYSREGDGYIRTDSEDPK